MVFNYTAPMSYDAQVKSRITAAVKDTDTADKGNRWGRIESGIKKIREASGDEGYGEKTLTEVERA